MGFTTCFFFRKKNHRKQHRTSTRNKHVWFLMVAPKNGSLWSKDIQGAPNLGSPASSFGSVCPSDKRVGLEDGPINGGWLMGFPDRNVSILLGFWFYLLGGFQKWEKTYNNLKFPGNPGQNPKFLLVFPWVFPDCSCRFLKQTGHGLFLTGWRVQLMSPSYPIPTRNK